MARKRAKQNRFGREHQKRRNPYKPLIAERYTEYCDVLAQKQGISRHKALCALIDLGIATYEAMASSPPSTPTPNKPKQGQTDKP